MVTYLTQQSAGAIATTPLSLRVENALVSYVSYITKMFWPGHLAVLYPFPDAVPVWQVVGAGVLLVAITVLAIRLAGRFRYFITGWLWFLGMLVPVIGFIQAGGQAMADRFSYLPEIGLVMAFVWGAADFIAAARLPRRLVRIVAAGVIAILAVCSLHQISFWRDSESLWRHTIASTPPNPIAQINLGLALEAQGHSGEAIGCFQKAIEISPSHPFAYLKLGVALVRQGRIDEAVEDYQQAIAYWPDDAQFHRNLAGVLFSRGQAAEAIEQYQTAIKIDPGDADAYKNLASVLAQQGRMDEAIADCQRAVQLDPGFENHCNLGVLLAMRSRLDEAADQFRAATQLKPDSDQAHYLLGLALGKGK